ncbi:hypothetical protein TWF694_005593 [Orbilia ellipsospora]|uniref:Uncharacterized protein n=1 Tax=Orbilia ellipsospora TaxID=2528407 RepID=A0AAV9WTK1_9PEZI
MANFRIKKRKQTKKSQKPTLPEPSHCPTKPPKSIMTDLRRWGIDKDKTSRILDKAAYDTDGFAEGYELREHTFWSEADEGSIECRRDWISYVGPTEIWGNQNLTSFNFLATGMPFCKPERLRLSTYMFEFAFLYDTVAVETSNQKTTVNDGNSNFCLEDLDSRHKAKQSASGVKQLQSKILLELMKSDPVCGRALVDAWQNMIHTSAQHDKKTTFKNLDDFLDFRIVDGGCIFSGLIKLYGMGIKLTDEQHVRARQILRPCFSQLLLVNDFYSFNEEYREMLELGQKSMLNAVWLFMQWEKLDVDSAKERLRQTIIHFERKWREDRKEFIENCLPEDAGLLAYVEEYTLTIPSNLIWSISCPRYHPELRPKPGSHSMLVPLADDELANLPARFPDPLKPALPLVPLDDPSHQSVSNSFGTPSDASSSDSEEPFGTSNRNSIISISSIESSEITDAKKSVGLDDQIILAPYEYLSSMPSKGVREALVDSLNIWFDAPDDILKKIKSIGQILHTASIMLDDMEDNSPLRRGKDAAHVVYGQPQVINSANYLIIMAMDQVRELDNPRCLEVFSEELRNSLIGQCYEMYWRDGRKCPTEEEYIDMVEKKTGGLFRFLTRLVTAMGRYHKDINLDKLAYLIGQYFQIRDDNMNLTNTIYIDQKGFCEDLDEGKFSYLIVHAWNTSTDKGKLQSLFEARGKTNSMTRSEKEEVLDILRKAGSFEYTEEKMNRLHREIEAEIERFEEISGKKNWSLRWILFKLAN